MNRTAGVVIDIAGLTVNRFRRRVISDLSLQIPAGIITGLLGPSGSGKSTLRRAIVGAQRVTSGSITVLGRPAGTPQLRHRVAYSTQSASVYDDLTVRQNVGYFARILGCPSSDVERVISRVDLADFAAQRVDRLSGGQRSRVSLAIALLGSPEVLILDEPTVGLDPVLRRDLWSMFRSLADEGLSLLVSSHVMDEASRCDELVLLRDGAVIAQEHPRALLERTQTTDFSEAFLAIIEGSDS